MRLRERNDGSLGEALNLVEPVELFAARKKVGLDHDRVAAIDSFSLLSMHQSGDNPQADCGHHQKRSVQSARIQALL